MTHQEKKRPIGIGTFLQETYRLERLLGEGGMGAVYEASHSRLRRRFAVKILSPEVATFPEALARFRREALITSELGHPHLLEVIDFNETDDGVPYIVMELLEGEDLASLLHRSPRMTLELTLKIIQPAIAGLNAAHERGIIHRDLKPSNLFLCKHGEDTQFVKVVDFGISKVLGAKSALTQTHVTIGTPSYMAPEQAEGRAAEVDQRTDVYALGTIVYEMLGGRPPFVAETIPAMLYQVVHQAPLDLRQLRPDLPEPLYAVIDQALAKAPEDRFASVKALGAALARAAGKPASGLDDADKTLPVDSAAAVVEKATPAVAMGTTLSASAGQMQRQPPTKAAVLPRSRTPLIAGGAIALALGVVAYLALHSGPARQPDPRTTPQPAAAAERRDSADELSRDTAPPPPDSHLDGASAAAVDVGRKTDDARPRRLRRRIVKDRPPTARPVKEVRDKPDAAAAPKKPKPRRRRWDDEAVDNVDIE